jgi:hypothetical protein
MAIDKRLPIYRFVVGEDDEAGVTAVALVDHPAIEMNWQAFAASKVSFDFDDTLSTARGQELAQQLIDKGDVVYIISARSNVEPIYPIADKLGIPHNRIFSTGSNEAKIEKVKSLGITKHYDNNADVIKELGSIGSKFMLTDLVFKFLANKEKRIISGALMVADLPIYRKDEQGEYYGLFTAEDIYNIRNKFFKNNNTKSVNEMHDPNKMIDGVYMIESFIIDSKRGINAPDGLKLTDGSWFGSYKVDNEEIWNDFIKTGEFKGFSVEGVFKTTQIDSKPLSIIEQAIDIIKQIED